MPVVRFSCLRRPRGRIYGGPPKGWALPGAERREADELLATLREGWEVMMMT